MNLPGNSCLKGKQQFSYVIIMFLLLKMDTLLFPFWFTDCFSLSENEIKESLKKKSMSNFNRPKVLATVEFHIKSIVVIQFVLDSGSPW